MFCINVWLLVIVVVYECRFRVVCVLCMLVGGLVCGLIVCSGDCLLLLIVLLILLICRYKDVLCDCLVFNCLLFALFCLAYNLFGLLSCVLV